MTQELAHLKSSTCIFPTLTKLWKHEKRFTTLEMLKIYDAKMCTNPQQMPL